MRIPKNNIPYDEEPARSWEPEPYTGEPEGEYAPETYAEEQYYYEEPAPAEPYNEERERYYAERDRFYAERDRFYAERDEWYAAHERQSSVPKETEGAYESYAESGETEESDFDEEPRSTAKPSAPKKKKRRRKNRFLRRLILFLMAAVLVLLLSGKMPKDASAEGERIPGRCTVLLVGTDAEGYRTDTILLLGLDKSGGLRLLSIPRDTYVEGWYGVPKINSAYGAMGGGEAGMEELLSCVQNVLGFRPDGYMMVDLDAFVEAVDALGGVDFDVPVDMYYEDWTQDLLIDLRAGMQHLSGEQAMGLVRYRAGYANADIGRTEVQRDFIKAAMKQWLRPRSLLALPRLTEIYLRDTMTDLSFRNLIWIFRTAITSRISDMETAVLPGYSAMVGDASCYIAEPWSAADFLKEMSPY